MSMDLFDSNVGTYGVPQGEGYTGGPTGVGPAYPVGNTTQEGLDPSGPITELPDEISWEDIWVWQGAGYAPFNVPKERFVLRKMIRTNQENFVHVDYQLYFTEKTGDKEWTDQGVYPIQIPRAGASESGMNKSAKSAAKNYLIARYRDYAWSSGNMTDKEAHNWATEYVNSGGMDAGIAGVGILAAIAIIGIMFLG